MPMEGMNVDTIRQISRDLRAQAGLLNGVCVRIDGSINQTQSQWRGTNATDFQSWWRGQHRAKVVSLVQDLEGLAQSLSNNADEQEKASSDSVSPSYSFQGHPRDGGTGFMKDLIQISGATYEPDDLDRVPDGWHRLSTEELSKYGIVPSDLHDAGSGFDADVYVDETGRLVVSFRGTENLDSFDGVLGQQTGLGNNRDATTDWFGKDNLTAQDVFAISLAKRLKQSLIDAGENPDELTFTGHSLGGRLAELASVSTGTVAAAFNPASVSAEALDYAIEQRATGVIGDAKAYALTTDDNNVKYFDGPDQITDEYRQVTILHDPDPGPKSLWLGDFPAEEVGDGHGLDAVERSYDAAIRE